MPMLRQISWGVFASGVALPVVWAKLALTKLNEAETFIRCGLPVLGILGVAVFAAGAFSLVAEVIGLFAFHKLTGPRPTLRKLELVLIGSPAILAIVVLGLLLKFG
jgi:NADH:ubiquinone oxidoreductase subunit 6 (subunit J)